jgi:hypothetical protein
MPPRDTAIDIIDGRLGYKARIKLYGGYIDLALGNQYNARGRLTDEVLNAQSHICQQAKSAMAKKGRNPALWLSWDDIKLSVQSAERTMIEPTKPRKVVEKPKSHKARSTPLDDESLPTQTGQLALSIDPPGQNRLFEV